MARAHDCCMEGTEGTESTEGLEGTEGISRCGSSHDRGFPFQDTIFLSNEQRIGTYRKAGVKLPRGKELPHKVIARKLCRSCRALVSIVGVQF